jgi:hypothetical protein
MYRLVGTTTTILRPPCTASVQWRTRTHGNVSTALINQYSDEYNDGSTTYSCDYYVSRDTSEAVTDGIDTVVSSVATVFAGIGAAYLIWTIIYCGLGFYYKKKGSESRQAVYPQGGPQKY